MTLDSIIFFDLVFTIFVLAGVLIVIVLFFSKLLKRSNEYQKELESLKEETSKKAIRIIDSANNKALDIVQKANLFIDISNENFNDQLKNVTAGQLKSFEKATNDFIKLYGQVLNDLKSKNIEIFQNISKNIEIDTLEEITKFKETIEKETISSEQMIKKKIDHEYLLAKEDIEAYKKEKLGEVNDKIYETLERISKLVIGKALNLADHEELIIASLETAKKEGVFDEK